MGNLELVQQEGDYLKKEGQTADMTTLAKLKRLFEKRETADISTLAKKKKEVT